MLRAYDPYYQTQDLMLHTLLGSITTQYGKNIPDILFFVQTGTSWRYKTNIKISLCK